jgi:hypothetical protein
MNQINWISAKQKWHEQELVNEWLLPQIKDNPKAVFLTLKFRHKQTATKQKDDILRTAVQKFATEVAR